MHYGLADKAYLTLPIAVAAAAVAVAVVDMGSPGQCFQGVYKVALRTTSAVPDLVLLGKAD